jgi:hypothetical protein
MAGVHTLGIGRLHPICMRLSFTLTGLEAGELQGNSWHGQMHAGTSCKDQGPSASDWPMLVGFCVEPRAREQDAKVWAARDSVRAKQGAPDSMGANSTVHL